MIAGIDPGTRETGYVGLDSRGDVIIAGCLLAQNMQGMLYELEALSRYFGGGVVHRVAIERPQLYGIHDRSDPNKIGQLLIVGGRASAAFPRARLWMPYPATWKGQVPKDIHHKRLLRGLSPVSRFRLERDLADVPSSKQHNVLDALGLALWAKEQR